jgi:tetratricopeptide (TPR) repeat protein
LQAIADGPEDALHQGLTRLQAAEFLYEARLFPALAYTFKHALTHEVAYGSLLQERRRALHVRIVEVWEALAPAQVAEQVEHLAHHALRGEVWEKAMAYGRQAGAKAYARAAPREAVGYIEQALGALEQLPDQRDRRELAIELRLDLYSSCFALGEHQQTLRHLTQAETLATALGDQRRLGLVYVRLSNTCVSLGHNDRALAAGERALALATALGDRDLVAQAQARLGHVAQALGDYPRALALLRQALEARPEAPSRGSAAERLSRLRQTMVWRTVLLWSLAELGQFPEGEAYGEAGLRRAEAAEHLASLVMASMGVGRLALCKGDVQQAIAVLERGLRLCERGQLSPWFIMTAAPLGYAYTLAGRVPEALPLLALALAEADRSGFLYDAALYATWLSEASLLADRPAEARALAQRAWEGARAHQARGHQAYVLRLLGTMAVQSDPPQVEPAAAYYRQALGLAEILGMRPLQAHCHRDLGLLYTKTDHTEQARTALATAIAMYESMEMVFWLPETAAALAQVEGR